MELAREAAAAGEVPVGAVVVRGEDLLGEGRNCREAEADALCHAELLAISQACRKLHSWRLTGCELYVTLEPCPMCTGAIINAKIDKVVFGTMDMDYGACGSRYNLLEDNKAKGIEVYGGIEEERCSVILKDFFKKIRNK